MDKKQIIAVVGCLLLCAGIYLFAGTKKPKDKTESPVAENHSSHEAEQMPALDIEKYLADVNRAIKDPAQKEKINQLTTAGDYRGLMAEYQKMDKPIALAWYATRLAEKENTAESYINAGNYNRLLTQTAPDEKVRKFLVTNALDCFEKAVKLDSTNADNQVRLAEAYMESGGPPMQGVAILLEVVRKDSTHIPALMALGRFGIISGQYDKAIARLEKILYLQPENPDALLLAAEAYNGLGNRAKAIELLEQYKKTVKNPALRKEVEKSIQELKQQQS